MARYDKFDPYANGFRARVAVDYPDADLGKIFGCGINSAGNVVKGAGQTGIIGIMVVTQKPGRVGPLREVAVIDVMTNGCVTDFGPSDQLSIPGVNFGAAGTRYYSDINGVITSSSVEADLQLIKFGGTVSGGTFTLTYNGQTTTAIAYNAAASAVQAALQALSNIGSGNVLVTGGPGPASYTVAFTQAYENSNEVYALTANGGSLTGTSPTVAVDQGAPSTYVGFTVEPDRLQVAVNMLPAATVAV